MMEIVAQSLPAGPRFNVLPGMVLSALPVCIVLVTVTCELLVRTHTQRHLAAVAATKKEVDEMTRMGSAKSGTLSSSNDSRSRYSVGQGAKVSHSSDRRGGTSITPAVAKSGATPARNATTVCRAVLEVVKSEMLHPTILLASALLSASCSAAAELGVLAIDGELELKSQPGIVVAAWIAGTICGVGILWLLARLSRARQLLPFLLASYMLIVHHIVLAAHEYATVQTVTDGAGQWIPECCRSPSRLPARLAASRSSVCSSHACS